MMKRHWGVLGAVLASCLPAAHADEVSTFDAGAEGWRVVSFVDFSVDSYGVSSIVAPIFDAGGFITTTDPDNGDFTFAAPERFLQAAAGATSLSWSLIHQQGDVNWHTTDLLLEGANGQRLIWRKFPDTQPGLSWITLDTSFTPSAEWRVNSINGPLASAADFQAVLGQLAGLYIHGEFTAGPEMSGLDNVRLISSVPEVSSSLLSAVGLLAMIGLSRARVRRLARH
jgi:Laminin B (Domain IV)